MAREKKKSLTRGEYRRHIFDRARGGHGVKGARGIYDDDAWIKRSFAEQYEQDNSKKGWWSLDSTDRAKFRASELEKARKAFRDSLSQHHWAKHRDNVNRFGQLADAYMNQTDAQFETTMAQMGISKPEDRARWRKAMEESLSNAVDGTAMSQNWDDQKDLAYSRGAPAQQNADAGEQTDGKADGKTGGTTGPGTVANGRAKAPLANAANASPALTPRNAGPTPQTTAGSMKRPWRVAGQSTNQIDGANVRTGNQPAMAHMDQDAANKARVAALRSGDQAQIQTALSSLTPSEAYELRQNERDRIDQIGKDRRARQAAEREAAAQRRADKRFADRTLYNEADWKNLGREGSNKADYSDRREGESDKDWAVRDKARQERQGRMDALLKRLDDMGVQDADKNSFYANDPNKQQNLARLRGLIVGDDGKVRGDITDAQIEGANATLDAWKKGADERGARNKAFKDMRQAEEISRLRDLYGMGGVSGDKVLAYHNRRMDAERKKILEGMQVAPGLSPQYTSEQNGATTNIKYDDTRPAAMAKFSQDWQKLLDTGFDVRKAFEAIQGDKDTWDAYQAGLDTIAADDPDRADKRDQLRRRFIVQQAMKQYGVGKEGGGEQGQAGRQITAQPATPDEIANGLTPPAGAGGSAADLGKAMAQNLPGKSILQPRLVADIENPIQPRQSQQTPGVQVFNSAAGAMQARNAANAAAGLRPRQPQAMLRPGDKREETMAW